MKTIKLWRLALLAGAYVTLFSSYSPVNAGNPYFGYCQKSCGTCSTQESWDCTAECCSYVCNGEYYCFYECVHYVCGT
jgi:hypothetical protein